MNRLTLGLSMGLMVLVGSGCGGSSTSTSSSSEVGTSFYIDSAVKGISYSCGTQSGTTDTNGTFTYEVGKTCKLSLGDIPLRTLAVEELVDGASFHEKNLTVARVLQSVDEDGNASNGITLDSTVLTALKSASIKEFPSSIAKLNELISIVESVPLKDSSNRNFVDENNAQSHLDGVAETLLKELISGGTFYIPIKDGSNSFIDKTVINSGITSETVTRVVGANAGSVSTDTIAVNGTKFTFPSRSSYVILEGVRKGYLLFNNFTDDGTPRGQARLYLTQTDAEAYLNE